ncbi:D-serine ammonia-lyase DSD1 [Sugiyamaella lignohabitans]|uniref:D-serine dehydratase n=1 Tax=Sugiyamaella lignohabitans TaxID=796027 RepID=A0A167CFS3_9ASCO|nr:D-serine ammonia-lyase DSD1 [Sugiyamaella lignohabitans]ANB11632.1 D-serine ammonia-lyase DSD1 [Sugiyamaella lignohabitans]
MATFSSAFHPSPDVAALRKQYVGKTLADIPTPAFIVNRKVMKKNCDTMLQRAANMKAAFRAHVKTHKCDEGVILQLGPDGQCDRVVVSTLMEAWKMIPFYKSGQIKDVLYGLPVVKSRLDELSALRKEVAELRLMIDHPSQVDVLNSYNEKTGEKPWSIFIKVNMGTNRAGVISESEELKKLIQKALDSTKAVSLYGFYCHAGHSYASSSQDEAKKYLYQEIEAADKAAVIAKSLKPDLDLVISVGSTPTSHSSEAVELDKLANLSAHLELHAGNYPFCDLQQIATNCITKDNVACTVLAEVASCYAGRGTLAPGETLVNAGVIALAREPGPIPGLGQVVTPGHEGWFVGRVSQEHGILVPGEKAATPEFPELGDRLQIIPQHSCITANAYHWYYITDDDDKVVDIWGTWRGW